MFALISGQSVVSFPYDPARLMRDNPHVSFSFPMSDEELLEWNVVRVKEEYPAPIVDPATQRCDLGEPKLVDGEWVRNWEIKDLSEAEKAEAFEIKAAQVRRDRNNHLAACDWTQLSDAPLTTEQKALWAAYRQELRDISAHEQFPWNVAFPVRP